MVGDPARAHANGIEVAYETFGDRSAPPILLVMGLGSQMIAWPDQLCADLAAAGHFVIRFDNRDTGLSSHLDGEPVASPLHYLMRRRAAPYGIDDMAEDAAGLLDALAIGSAHVVGASMGGFIAQTLALRHPNRVRSLSLMMTSTGSHRVGRPRTRVLLALGRPRRGTNRQEAVAAVVATLEMIGSPAYPTDPTYLAELAGRSYDRSHDVAGFGRQLGAILSQPDRTAQLRSITVPTVVIHGLSDPLVAPSGGRALAAAIPGARFVGLPGAGHDLPPALWGRYVGEILATVRSGEQQLRASA